MTRTYEVIVYHTETDFQNRVGRTVDEFNRSKKDSLAYGKWYKDKMSVFAVKVQSNDREFIEIFK